MCLSFSEAAANRIRVTATTLGWHIEARGHELVDERTVAVDY
jgi:hypothetical protein